VSRSAIRRVRHEAQAKKRTPREHDLIDLLEHIRERDRRLADSLVVIATHGDARVLAAVGTVVDFAVKVKRGLR